MTVCVACISEHGKSIVASCDAKLSTGYTSSDQATLKAVRVGKTWAFMYAASDISPVVPIRQEVRDELKKCPNNLQDVASVFRKAFLSQVSAQAGALNQIPQETNLGTILMVFGFDREAKPHIFTVCDPQGKTEYHDIVGFQTIGSGAQTASSILYFYGQNPNTPLPLSIYHASAAKFMAESATDVGKYTYILVLNADGEAVFLYDPDIEELRRMWDYDGKPHLPASVHERVEKIYHGAKVVGGIVNRGLTNKGIPEKWSEEDS